MVTLSPPWAPCSSPQNRSWISHQKSLTVFYRCNFCDSTYTFERELQCQSAFIAASFIVTWDQKHEYSLQSTSYTLTGLCLTQSLISAALHHVLPSQMDQTTHSSNAWHTDRWMHLHKPCCFSVHWYSNQTCMAKRKTGAWHEWKCPVMSDMRRPLATSTIIFQTMDTNTNFVHYQLLGMLSWRPYTSVGSVFNQIFPGCKQKWWRSLEKNFALGFSECLGS